MTIQPMPAPDEYERTDSRALRVDEVQAQWLQNLGAGVGAAAMTALVAWGVGIDLAGQWRWPIILGGTVFGLGQVVRAFVDEFRAERRWRRRENEHRIEMSVLVDLCDRLEEERDAAGQERDRRPEHPEPARVPARGEHPDRRERREHAEAEEEVQSAQR